MPQSSAPKNGHSLSGRQFSKGENPLCQSILLRVEVWNGHSKDFGESLGCGEVGDVLAPLILVDARTGDKLVNSGLDAKLLLGQPGPQACLANASRNHAFPELATPKQSSHRP